MKKLIVGFTLVAAVSAYAYGAFCEGFEAGYIAGYCYNKGYGCVEPVTPVCPVPRVGEDTYQGGYNRGFLLGISKQR